MSQRGDINFEAETVIASLEGPWQVSFDVNWGGPESVIFENLEDWTKRPEEGIRYYSGTAVYQKSFDLLEEQGDQRRMACTLSNIANVYSDCSEYDTALGIFNRAAEIHARLNDQRGLAADYNNIGLVLEEQGNYQEARENYQKALVINTRMENSRNRAKNMANLPGNLCTPAHLHPCTPAAF